MGIYRILFKTGRHGGAEAEEVSRKYFFPDKFPARKDILNVIAEYLIEADREKAAAGRHFTELVYEDGWAFEYHAVTWDDINAILDLLKDAKPSFYMDEDVAARIINEEAQAYYSGQKGIEDVVKVIQNRVQLYMDENR